VVEIYLPVVGLLLQILELRLALCDLHRVWLLSRALSDPLPDLVGSLDNPLDRIGAHALARLLLDLAGDPLDAARVGLDHLEHRLLLLLGQQPRPPAPGLLDE